MEDYQSRMMAAFACYINRKSRNDHPKGSFKTTNFDGIEEKWWDIHPNERRDCCSRIKPPTSHRFEKFHGQWLSSHCRTAKHVANLFGVAYADLRRAIRTRQVTAQVPLFTS